MGDLKILLQKIFAAIFGGIGGKTTVVSSNIVMSVAGAYTTGDYIGTSATPQSFSDVVTKDNGGTGVIKGVIITDKSATAAVAMELWLFNATFTAPTDNAAWDITDAQELASFVGIIPLASTKWYSSSSNKGFTDDTIALPFKLASNDKKLYYALVSRGSTPSWASLDLKISLCILQD